MDLILSATVTNVEFMKTETRDWYLRFGSDPDHWSYMWLSVADARELVRVLSEKLAEHDAAEE